MYVPRFKRASLPATDNTDIYSIQNRKRPAQISHASSQAGTYASSFIPCWYQVTSKDALPTVTFLKFNWNYQTNYKTTLSENVFLYSLISNIILLTDNIISLNHFMYIINSNKDTKIHIYNRYIIFVFRNQRLEEELEELEHPAEPRINPLELVSPPTYEEAVQMSRLARSMDDLDEVTVENGTLRAINSMDNLRTKKRRARRSSRKRTNSEDDLLRREERRHERIRRERSNSNSNICDADQSHNANPRQSRTSLARRSRRQSAIEDSIESSSSKDRPRPQTPSARKRKRRQTVRNEHVTDDEDSDAQTMGSSRSVVIRELRREPRSAYRESYVGRESWVIWIFRAIYIRRRERLAFLVKI